MFKRVLLVGCVIGMLGCARVIKKDAEVTSPAGKAPVSETPVAATPSADAKLSVTGIQLSRQPLIVFIPFKPSSVKAAVALFDRYPTLRMVMGLSPRFYTLPKDLAFKAKFQGLIESQRLDVALMIPNAPVMPLLMDSDSARRTLKTKTGLPVPAYRYPEDVTQIMARAKNEFYKLWGRTPTGVLAPHGAVNPDFVRLAGRMNVRWMVGAYGFEKETLYRSGGPILWDGTLVGSGVSKPAIIFDERKIGDTALVFKNLEALISENLKTQWVLPEDTVLAPEELPKEITQYGGRTWTDPNWAAFIGSPRKNNAWKLLTETRQVLEEFKNSGDASLERLDKAFDQMYIAQNANLFADILEDYDSEYTARNKERELKKQLGAVYQAMNKLPAKSLQDVVDFVPESTTPIAAQASANVVTTTVPLQFSDPTGDDRGAGKLVYPDGLASGQLDLERFEIIITDANLEFIVAMEKIPKPKEALGTTKKVGPMIDIYMDLNKVGGVGYASYLSGRDGTTQSEDAWEFALTLSGNEAQLFQAQTPSNYEFVNRFPVRVVGHEFHVTVPRTVIRGNPWNWGFQVMSMATSSQEEARLIRPYRSPKARQSDIPIYDLLDAGTFSQMDLLNEMGAGVHFEIPFLRSTQAIKAN